MQENYIDTDNNQKYENDDQISQVGDKTLDQNVIDVDINNNQIKSPQSNQSTIQLPPQHLQSQPNQYGIQIDILGTQIKDKINKYVLYHIKGHDNNGTIDVYRRYSDFYHLRQQIVIRWPGCYIPAIPPKQTVGNLEVQFIEERRRQLDDFCKKIARMPYIYYTEEFKQFLKTETIDVEKTLNGLHKQTYEELINKYKATFPDLNGKEINHDINLKITQFAGFLRKVKIELEKWKTMAKAIAISKENLVQQQSTLINVLLPNYEKICFLEYANKNESKLIFGNQSDLTLDKHFGEIKDLINQNSFNRIYDMIKVELRDIEAFQDSINQRDTYENIKQKSQQKMRDLQQELEKLIAGKSTMKSIFSKGNKEDHIQKGEIQIQQQTQEIDDIGKICLMITAILGYTEIEKFKKEKFKTYFEILKQITSSEIDATMKLKEFWNYLGGYVENVDV